mmetsp:Transcript_8309/g.20937  ORF Transcript_8309/g.20937 Transcript_8309/m.20937 type:complete len:682 (-) Transcript_8309:10-2055(-)
MATEEEFRLAKFKIYGLLFSPGRGVDGLSLTDPDPGDSSALSSDIAAHSSSASDVTSASASASGDGASANKAVEKKKSGKRRRWRFTKVKENKPAAPNGKAVKEAKSPKQRTAKASSSSATSSGGSTRAAAADDDADEAHTHSRSETLSEYSYEVVDEEEDDEDEWETDEAAIQRLARSGEANGPRLLRVFYDDDLYKTFAVDLHTTAAEIIREGGEKLHLRSGAVQFALFLIRDNEDIRRLMPNERPGLLLCQYAKRNDIKFAFLSTMGRFNTAMRNRTFRAWINWKLSLLACDELIEVPSVRSFLDFADGIVILHLLEALGFPLPSKYHKRPSKDKHRLENIDTALQCCRKAGCVFPDQVSARAILLRDPMIASDFVWSIIYRVQAPLVTNSHLEFQFIDELLFWCQKNLDTYKTIRAHKLMDCLCDGLAFCALIHRFRESALNYNMVEYTHQNLHRKNSVTAQVAVDAAEREFSIPALLQPADFDAPQVDELSVIISLSVYMQILEKKQVPPPVPFAERLRLQPHTPAGGAQLGEPAMSREDIKRLSKEERERKKRDKDDLKRRKEEEKRLERDGSAACKETGEVVAVAASASNSSSGSLTDVASLSSSTGTLSGSMLGSPTVPHQPVKRKDGLKTIPVFFQGFSNSFRSFQVTSPGCIYRNCSLYAVSLFELRVASV